MKQNFFEKLKEVSFFDFFHIILFLLALFPAWLYKKKRKHLWLICENRQEARDNGYWLYRYIRENKPDCDVVYAIDPKSKDYGKVAALGETVPYGTFRHWIYYLAAEANISSQKGGKPNAAVCYLLEVYGIRKNTRVFLQHGVTKDDVSFIHYEHAKFSLFVTSTKREYDYVSKYFHYPPGVVQLLGMCRFDNLHNKETRKEQILVMPTWRSWISPPSNGKSKYHGIEEIRKSGYYREWNSFLQDERLKELLERTGKRLFFYQHREMRKFQNLFVSDCPNIIIAGEDSYDVQELLIASGYLITDYSSIAMDFAYMGKPLCYFQFDYERFRKEQYSEGYFSYEEDGFGPVCYKREKLLDCLLQMTGDCSKEWEKYQKRALEFFTLRDDKNCERNYNAIKQLLDS